MKIDENKQMVKLALVVNKKTQIKGSCLSDNEMAELISHRMDKDKLNSVWQHLTSCTDCYNLWIELTKEMPVKTPKSFFKPVLMAACIILTLSISMYLIDQFFNLLKTPTESLIDNSYSIAQKHNTSFTQDPLILNINDSNLSSNRLGYSSHLDQYIFKRQAFIEGLLYGKSLLSKKEKKSDSEKWKDENKISYEMGHWFLILRSACISELNSFEFWELQIKIANKITDKLPAERFQDEIIAIQKIHQSLKQHEDFLIKDKQTEIILKTSEIINNLIYNN